MEKINIAELLKDCPKGMELDCTMYEDTSFVGITENLNFPIRVKIKVEEGNWTKEMTLTSEGKLGKHPNAKCIIFPKGKTTWEGFIPPSKFKDGDIIYTLVESGFEFISIFKKTSKTRVYSYIDLGSQFFLENSEGLCTIDCIISQRLATEEEKQRLFKAIKDNGYKWNTETKTLEKLPKFKVGDKIKRKDLNNIYATEITSIKQTIYMFRSGNFQFIECVDRDYELVPNKFDISTLVSFESRVLVRDTRGIKWCGAFYSHYDATDSHPFHCIGFGRFKQCIPYEGNEHLLGTINDCDEYYKTWK